MRSKGCSLAVASALATFTALRSLHVSLAIVHDSVIEAMANSLSQLPCLHTLDARQTEAVFGDNQDVVYNTSMAYRWHMRLLIGALHINLQSLKLTDWGLTMFKMPHVLCRLTNLQAFHMEDSWMRRDVLGFLPDSASAWNATLCTSLKVLHLADRRETLKSFVALARLLQRLQHLAEIAIDTT